MSKAKIIDKKSVDSILGEKNLLSQLHHPFIVNMVYSFQDLDYLYLVMDLLPGGNLRYHLCVKRRFNEKQNKFLIGCILVGLEYIHGQCILHRDIKPENLVFDSNGYLRITDFGIAKKYVVNNKKDTSGTVGYLAPEILCNQNHTYSIDYYAVGIIAYELAYGHRPYIGRSKHEVKQLILTQQAHIDYDELPNGYQDEAADFINGLIQRKPKNRLGKDSIFELINHPWLKDFNWEDLKEKKMKAYYIPKQGDNFDKKYCLQNEKLGTETIDRYKEITLEPNYSKIFKKFDCDKVPDELKVPEPKIKLGDQSSKDKDKENNNNVCNSSSNSTLTISRNIKLKGNPENKKVGSNSKTVNQRNNSMGNILLNQNNNINININNINKQIIKSKPNLNNILGKENNDINNINNINSNDKEKDKDKELNKKEEENNLKFTNELKYEIDKKRETKNNFYKNNEISNTIYNKKIVSTMNDKKKVIRLIDDESNNILDDKINNIHSNFNKSNSIGNINININYNQKNINNNFNPNISIRAKNKSAILDSIFDLSLIEKDKNRERSQEKDDIIISQKLTNLNQYVINNHKQKKLGKNKILTGSNSSLSLFPNEIFNNFKGNYFKKMIKSKILSKDLLKLKSKNITNNSLLNSNSTQNIFKKSTAELSSSYLKPTKKHFLKREIFNGTFYPNKSSSTKYFFFPRKSTSTSIAKKIDAFGNKRLSSSSSIRSLKNAKNEHQHDNASSIFPGMDSIFNPNLSKDSLKNHEKNLPFINISLNKKNIQNFRNNFSFVNKSHKKNFLNGNGYFSERIKDNEIKGISKGSLNN